MGFKFRNVALLLCIFVAVFRFGIRQVEADSNRDSSAVWRTRTGRFLAEAQNDTQSALTTRTERVDPLNDLKKYRGGYNITNKHYWSSTIFTGKFGYIIAALWIVAGLIYAIVLLVAALCCNNKRRAKKKRFPCTRRYCIWPVAFGILFTLLAIVASGVSLGGSTRFHSSANTIKNIILEAANNASTTIHTVTGAVRAMQSDPQVNAGIFTDKSSRLNSTLQRLEVDADNIERKALKNMRLLSKGLKIMNVVTIVTISLNLVAILALLAFGPSMRFQKIFHMLIILCWILTFLVWLYFGLYYFLDKFAGDTCAALNEYRQDPRNSTLSSILPCNDNASARTALRDVGAGIHDKINQVNANISSLQLQSLPGVEYICNPFSGPPDYNYQPENCSSDTIKIGNIPKVLKIYTCFNETCQQSQFIPASTYNTTVVYTSSIQSILDAYPGMMSLVNCQLVKDAFSKILFDECKPLKKYVHMTWAAFVTLSTVMVMLLLIWSVVARYKRKFHLSDGSVKPHSAPIESSEVMASKHLDVMENP